MKNFKSNEHNKSGKCKVERGKLGLRLQDSKSEVRKTVKALQSCSPQSCSLNTNNFQFSTLNCQLPNALLPSKKAAFTLAEVLITIGIIGVVAAMTLPTLIQKQQKMVWVNQLKKSVNVLEQGFQKMLADEGLENLTDTFVWVPNIQKLNESGEGCWYGSDYKNSGNCKLFGENLGKYFKNIGFESYGIIARRFDGTEARMFHEYNTPMILSDGTMIFWDLDKNQTKTTTQCNNIKSLGGNMCSNLGWIYLDVNGKKGPNIFGRDIFLFSLSNKGKLYPIAGKDYALFNSQVPLKRNAYYLNNDTDSYCGTAENVLGSRGLGCAARIIENNWVMDY